MPKTVTHIRDICKRHIPHSGQRITYDIEMDTKTILANNLKVLKGYYGISTLKMAKKCGVGNGTIGRALLGQGALDLDSITSIAVAFKLEPWQLLVPNLDPGNPCVIQELTATEKNLYEKLKLVLREN